MSLPRRCDPSESEPRWQKRWQQAGLYRFDADRERPVFSIDTPPPTVSGELHVGHVFSYTHTDLAARFQRMRGRNVFYPMGWDDNGLPTERRVQRQMHVRPDREEPYDPDFTPEPGGGPPATVGRRTFLELCRQVARRDEAAYERLWRRLGLSVDWSLSYATSDARSRRVAQLDFLRLVRKGEAYSADAPAMWDTDFQTAIAQAETEDRELEGLELRVRFGLADGGSLPIMTTRPELLGACVAVLVHPDDERYTHLIGATALTPGYRAPVPVMAHPLAEPDKGTGAVMVCTFGDVTDLLWWRELDLPTRPLVGRDGRILPARWGDGTWPSQDPGRAHELHARIAGLPVREAKRRMADLLAHAALAADGSGRPPLDGEPTRVRQTVPFYEKGNRPLEIILTRQWFIRLLDKKEALLALGRRVRWHPEYMRSRYEQWVEGLKYDWCVSRQRYLGVPIPLWYALGADGRPRWEEALLPKRQSLPVDPARDAPEGYTEQQRDRPDGFTAETDVLDTWATSSLTPRIPTGWPEQQELFERLYPMDLRPQGHEIIRTWAFYTIARAYLLDGRVPWRHIVLSGLVTDPRRQKLSKSCGSSHDPESLIERWGADALRYWAACARPGTDTAYDESVFRTGKRLVTKLLNAGRLVIGRLAAAGRRPARVERAVAEVTRPLDRAHLALLAEVVRDATGRMEAFQTADALQRVETWFWSNLCDNFLELTKARAYRGDRSALAAWEVSLSAVLRLVAPFLPHVTEEVHSWWWGREGGSVHTAPWPEDVPVEGGQPEVFTATVEALTAVRRGKTEAGVSLRTPIEELIVRGPAGRLTTLRPALEDFLSAARAEHAELVEQEAAELTATFRLRDAQS